MSNIRPSNLPIEETDLIGFVHTDRGIDGSAKFNLANVSSALNLDGMATQAPSNVAITGGAIDGTTIGATTPSTIAGTTGAFTSDTAGTILGVRNSAAGATKYTRFSLGNDSSATIAELYTFSSTYTPSAWEKPSGMGVFSSGSGGLSLVSQSGDVRILAGSLSTVHGLFTSTGLNSTAIGATTPSTGAFTTGTFSGVSGSNILTLTGADTNGNADMEIRSTGTAGNSRLFFGDTAGQTGSLIFSHASNSFALNQSLAVTGALSSTTGANFATSSGSVGIGTASPASKLHLSSTGQTVLTITGDSDSSGADVGYTGITLNWSGAERWNIGPAGTGTNNLVFRGAGSNLMTLTTAGALTITGALSKGSGSFRIEHPLPSKSATHQLVHSFIEGPKADLIYRGKITLVDGKASVNIDDAATMTEGTFEMLCRDAQCFTTNESGWTAIRGKVTGNILTIEAQDSSCIDEISWMVIGERKDKHMLDTDWTDENGKVIVEPLKPAESVLESN